MEVSKIKLSVRMTANLFILKCREGSDDKMS